MQEQNFYFAVTVVWVVLAIASSAALFFTTAPYGKFARDGYGALVNRTAGWVIMESPAVWMMVFFFMIGDRTSNAVAMVFLSLWLLHYVQRTYVFPFRMRGKSQSITLVTVALGFLFNAGNAYLNGRYLFWLSPPYETSWFGDPRFIAGLFLFFVGFAINIRSDSILRSLRKPGETGYKIPQGGMFRFVSAANYFGELIEWAGWAVLTWSPAGAVFFFWTAANLVPRGVSQHKWYLEKFSDYPTERKAIIPFLY